MIVKVFIDREFIVFFIQNEAQTHVAQKVLVDDFISGRLVSALQFVQCSDISRPRRVRTAAKSQSEDQCPLLPRAGSRESAAAQS